MEKSVFTRHDFYKTSVRHDRTNSSFIYLTDLRYSNDSADLSDGSVDSSLIRTTHLNLTNTIILVDRDSCTSLFLHTLYNLSTRADHSSNEFFRYVESLNTRNMRFKFNTWLCDSLSYLTEDMLTSGLSLQKSLLKNIEAQTVTFDIHLRSSQTVFCTGCLKVHITKVILITKDIA